jgi:hypothetical protein
MVFLFMEEATKLLELMKSVPDMEVTLQEKPVDPESGEGEMRQISSSFISRFPSGTLAYFLAETLQYFPGD